MNWEQCALLDTVDTGQTDELGNAIFEKETVMKIKARFTPWTNEEIQLDSRGVTKSHKRIVIPVCYREVPKCRFVLADGAELEITEIIDISPRYTAVLVKAYKE